MCMYLQCMRKHVCITYMNAWAWLNQDAQRGIQSHSSTLAMPSLSAKPARTKPHCMWKAKKLQRRKRAGKWQQTATFLQKQAVFVQFLCSFSKSCNAENESCNAVFQSPAMQFFKQMLLKCRGHAKKQHMRRAVWMHSRDSHASEFTCKPPKYCNAGSCP